MFLRALPMLSLLPLTAGCDRRGPMSTLDPAGPSAAAIATVGLWMLVVATVVTIGVVTLWLVAMRRRADGKPPTGSAGEPAQHAEHAERAAQRSGRRWIIGGGIVLPMTAIVALLVFGTPAGRHQLAWPLTFGPAPLQVEAIGHQWWWEMRYPDSGVVLTNELRMPVGRPVDVHTGSADVIHSFWVPRLGGKLDAIPGHTRVVRLQADAPGIYRGACAEFCGLGHAHMALTVIAMEPAEFDAWLDAQRTQIGEGPR